MKDSEDSASDAEQRLEKGARAAFSLAFQNPRLFFTRGFDGGDR